MRKIITWLSSRFIHLGLALISLWTLLELGRISHYETERSRFESRAASTRIPETIAGLGDFPLLSDSTAAGAVAGADSARLAREEADEDGRIGWLLVPRLRISAPIEAGTGQASLLLAVGHVKGTAFPGERGNVGLAAHRDSYFRPLEHIARGDTVIIATADGRFVYLADTTRVVSPSDVEVLKPNGGSELTLITCYPFRYIGPAPKRFVVSGLLAGAEH